MTATPAKRLKGHPTRTTAASQLVKAVQGGLIDQSQVSEIADSLQQTPISSVTTTTTESGSNATSSATPTVGRRSKRLKKRSAVVVENDMLVAEKVLTTALTAASRAVKHRRLKFHQEE